MVVRHNDIHTSLHSPFDGFKTCHPIIASQNQLNTLVHKVLVASQIRPITIYQTIGHIVNNTRTQHLQGLIENQSRGNAVSIVVTVNQDKFLILNGCLDSFHSAVHIIE